MIKLEVKNLSFSYEDKIILNDINFSLKSGVVATILGESGVGKSTLFNLLAGFIHGSGEIVINMRDDERLKFAYMQQKDLLFGHKNVLENIMIPLKINGFKSNEAKKICINLLDEFNLSEYAKMYPNELSGGLKKRISFIRAMSLKASVYLLDEPFTGLDEMNKKRIYEWFLELSKKYNLSVLLITHDLSEAKALSDEIYVLKKSINGARLEPMKS